MTMITSVAGNGAQGYDGDNGPATQALMDNPFHVDLDRTERYLYIADCFNYCVRMVDLQTGSITTIVGMGEAGYSGDRGPAVEARIEEPYAIQVADNGDVYVLQRFSPAIRKVDASTGMISTVAGDGTVGYSGDGGPATQAQMREPNDCALDGKGGLLIADIQDQRIRRLDWHHYNLCRHRRESPHRRWWPGLRGWNIRSQGDMRRWSRQYLHLRARGQLHPNGRLQRDNYPDVRRR